MLEVITMTERHATTPPSGKDIARLMRDFVGRFIETVRMPAGNTVRPPVAYWLAPKGILNHVRVDTYLCPRMKEDGHPLVVRISINHYALDDPEVILKRMGWRPFLKGRHHDSPGWSFELSVLPEELRAFAPWIASLAEAHAVGRDSVVGPTPYPCRFWNEAILHCNYAWSSAAWQRMQEFEKRRGRRIV